MTETLTTDTPPGNWQSLPPSGHERTKDLWLAEARELARLAGPIIVTQLAQMGVGTVDVLMLGALSKEALAASALGLSLFYGMWLFGMGPAVAVSPIIAQILGARRNGAAQVRATVRMALWAVIMMSPALMLFLWLTEDILLAIGQPAELSREAGAFACILALGLPFTLAFNVLRGYATALSLPNAPLAVMGLTIVFNALAGYALIFGHFGAPRLGLIGAGIASTISFAFSLLAMIAAILVIPELRRYRIFRRFGKPAWQRLIEIFRLGMPIGLTMIFEAMFFNTGTLMMGYFGTSAVAAHQIALNVVALAFMVPMGLATAATVRVGLAAGAGDKARVRRAGGAAMGMGICFMSICGILMAFFPHRIAAFYIDGHAPGNAEVIAMAIMFLRVGALFQLFDSLQVTAALSLRGLKDAAFPMWLAGGSYWLIGFPAALLLAFGFDLEGFGVWLAFLISLVAAAAAMSARFAYLSGAIGAGPLLRIRSGN
jgi:MATE family multidrug resistance protein